MDDFLYLDTARVGRPSPRTLTAPHDSLRLAAEEGGSVYFDRFLAGGLAACPPWMQSRYPGLLSWRGVASLKADLRSLAGAAADMPVLLANRSTELMALAARLLFPRCRDVLSCDLGWPAYQHILEERAAQSASRLSVVPLRDLAFGSRATADEVVEEVSRAFIRFRCDGLFLPSVSHHGVRLPVERIVRRIQAQSEVRLIVIDGSQEFCNVETELANDYYDLYLTGCHKWLAGHYPMGVAFYGKRRTHGFIDTMVSRFIEAGVLCDPLIRLTQQLENSHAVTDTETVNLSALFTSQAASLEASVNGVAARVKNIHPVALAAAESGWLPDSLDLTLRSGIMVAKAVRDAVCRLTPIALRNSFRESGVGVTAYMGGFVRLSMPTNTFSTESVKRIYGAFHTAA